MDCVGNSSVVIPSFAGEPCPNFTVCLLELTVVIAVTFLVLAGNLLSLIVLAWTPSLHNSHGFLIMSLSASDLVAGLVTALAVYPSANFDVACWPYGKAICAMSAFLGNMANFNSLLTLMLLSVERYVAVVYPLKYVLLVTKRTTLAAIFLTWVFATGSQTSIITGHPGYLYVRELNVCMPQYFENPIYGAVVLFGIYIPCFTVIVLTSFRVRSELAASSRIRKLMTAPNPAPSAADGQQSRGVHSEASTDKLARMVRFMNLALVITWLPFIIMSVVSVMSYYIPHGVLFVVYWLLLCNAFLNTTIYFIMTSAFREAFRKMVQSLVPRACLRLGELDRLSKQWCTGPDSQKNVQPGDIKLPTASSDVPGRSNSNLEMVKDNEGYRDDEHNEANGSV